MARNRSFVDMIYRALKAEIKDMRESEDDATTQRESSLFSEAMPASTLANAPLAVDAGLGDNISYTTFRWISDGRKSGEGAGVGTGVLGIYDATNDKWIDAADYSDVTV